DRGHPRWTRVLREGRGPAPSHPTKPDRFPYNPWVYSFRCAAANKALSATPPERCRERQKLKVSFPPMIMWSHKVIPKGSRALTSFWVAEISKEDGAVLPVGWLWHRMTEVAPWRRAHSTTIRT